MTKRFTLTTAGCLALPLTMAAAPAVAEVRSEAVPPVRSDGALTPQGRYALDCWQGGQKVVAERGSGEVILPAGHDATILQVKAADGSRVLVVVGGDSLCRVSTVPTAPDGR